MDNENQRELDVLAALEGIHRMQESIRDTELDMVVETGIIFLRLHYQRLPPGVARRLTEISPPGRGGGVGGHPGEWRDAGAAAKPGRPTGERRSRRPGHPGGECLPGAAGLRPARVGGGGVSGRKAGAMGLVERLAAALAVNEIVRSRRFLGEHTSKEDREELLKLTASELTSTAQVLASAVHLRQQVETAEFTRALIEQQKAAQQPPGGPLAC